MNYNSLIQDRTKKFAVRVVKAYAELNKRNFDDAGRVLSKQFLRSGTSIGANCSEAKAAQSAKDFISKYEIALKEAHEFKFWVEVFIESDLVPENKFSLLLQEVDEIGKILNTSIVRLKQKNL
jgi:four helix bundle protein